MKLITVFLICASLFLLNLLCIFLFRHVICWKKSFYQTEQGLYEKTKFNVHELKTNQSLHKVPNLIIQYGLGRTATTLQFQILCVMMSLLHESEKNSVGCYFNRKPVHNYTVVKTHSLSNKILESAPSDTWIFKTSGDRWSTKSSSKVAVEKPMTKDTNHFRVPYTASTYMVSKLGISIAYEYQHIFGISDGQMELVIEYLRYWDILRVCCGKQMSLDWRYRLIAMKNFTLHHGPHSLTYPACEMYNITVVEQLMMKTIIFQRFAHIPSLRATIGKPSNADGDIDGTYCERCNKNVSVKHLKFNQECA